MQTVDRRLPGSTLVETLATMLVACIVLVAAMDGLMLFMRMQTRQAAALRMQGRQREGYRRLQELTEGADSILSPAAGQMDLYHGGESSILSLRDSALVFYRGDFRDTLLREIGILRLEKYPGRPDTVTIGFGKGFMAKFPIRSAARHYDMALDEIEENYVYKE